MSGGVLNAGIMKQGGMNRVGFFNNLSIADGADTSILKITSADGTALSSTNVGSISLKDHTSGTPGEIATFQITADVSIEMTGCTWDLEADATDYMLSVYAINDAGTLKWGIASVNGLTEILNANDHATPASVIQVGGAGSVLVNSSLGSDSPCLEIGWFKADHTTSGAEWAIQTDENGSINMGPRPSMWQYFVTSAAWTTNTTYDAYWRRDGSDIIMNIKITVDTGAPGVGGQLLMTNPLGIVTDTTALMVGSGLEPVGQGHLFDADVGYNYHMVCTVQSNTGFGIKYLSDESTFERYLGLSHTAPITVTDADLVFATARLPITGWSP